MGRFQLVAGQRLQDDAALRHLAALFLDRLALARCQAGEEIVERLIAVVEPVELLSGPRHEAGVGQLLPIRLDGGS